MSIRGVVHIIYAQEVKVRPIISNIPSEILSVNVIQDSESGDDCLI